MKAHDWGDVAGLVFVLALILILVRPSSKAPTIIASLGDAFAKIISFATDSATAGAASVSGIGTSIGAGIGALG